MHPGSEYIRVLHYASFWAVALSGYLIAIMALITDE